MIPVTKPFIPPKIEYVQFINQIWDSEIFTNNGKILLELEKQLKNNLGLNHLQFVNNGTIAIQIAIKALGLTGEIITTPFSYVATTSSIVWEGLTPVFVDIDPQTLNIDCEQIERAITKNTSAILATHVYGNSCDIEKIKKISDKYNLKIIYDASHCFGTKYKGKSILSFGDISTISFHATKLFHTVEGGAVVSNNANLNQKISRLKNFGHSGINQFDGVGINGKNSELHAAMGLVNLAYIEEILMNRKNQSEYYSNSLKSDYFTSIKIEENCDWNYAYYPLIFSNEIKLLQVLNDLESKKIYPRRYFYPSLNTLNYLKYQKAPISENISSRVLCLPLFHSITKREQDLVINTIMKSCN